MEYDWATGALIGVLAVLAVYLYMAWAVDRRLTYVTTVYMHRSVAHDALRLRWPIRLWCDYTMNRVGLWVRGWVVCHRDHHGNTDQPKDPHSPWNLLDESIDDPDERRLTAVRLLLGVNRDLYQQVAYDEEHVMAHTAPIRTTRLDGLGKRFRNAVYVWYWATHLMGYLVIGYLLSAVMRWMPGSLTLNLWVYAALATPIAIASAVNGGMRYSKASARVNAYGHAWPTASQNMAVGHASDHPPTAREVAGEGNQAYHHRFQRSARLRDPRYPRRDDKGFELIRVLRRLRLVYDVNVVNKTSPEWRRLNDDLSVPEEVPIAA